MSLENNPTSPPPAGHTRPRRPLRLLVALAALLVVLPAALLAAAALLLPTDTIARVAADRAESALGVPVAIGDVEIDLWPVPSVSLVDARLGPASAPVAHVAGILLRPRLLPLLSGDVTIREIVIDRPDIRLAVDSSGVLNLPFGEGNAAPAPSGAEGAAVEFAVEELRIRHGRLSYEDTRDGTLLVLSRLEQELSLAGRVAAGSLARIALQGRISSDSVDATLPGRLATPLRGLRVGITHDAMLDREADLLDLGTLRLELQRLVLTGSGRIESVSDSTSRAADLVLAAEEFSFEDLARSLPEGFLSALLVGRDPSTQEDSLVAAEQAAVPIAYGGLGAIQARITGPLTSDSLPRFDGVVRLRDVSVARGGTPVVTATDGSIRFSNERVEASAIAGQLFGSPFTLALQVDDLAAPVATFAARGTARLEPLLAMAAGEPAMQASGGLPFDLRGRIRSADPARSTIEGTVGLAGLQLRTPSLLQSVQLSSGTLRFFRDQLRLEGVALAFGESRVRLELVADGWLPPALGDSSAVARVQFGATATTLDLDALLGASESEYTPLLFARLTDRPVNGRTAAEAAEEIGLELPELPRVTASGTVRAQRLVRNGLTYEDLDVELESSPTAVSAPSVRFGLMGGTVALGIALERADSAATLVGVYHLENVGSSAFFSRFTPFQGKLSGSMTMDGELSLQLDAQMLPVRPTVRSEGRIALTSGALTGWPLLSQVAGRLGLASFDTLAFREWSGDFLLAGPLVSLQRSLQSSELVQSEMAGSFDLGGTLDLGIVARLSPALAAGAREEIRTAAATLAGDQGAVPIGLRITGTVADPAVALDLSTARDEALARARERATEEAESAAERAAAAVARRALGDSADVSPGELGDAVRTEVRDRIRGLFHRPGGAAGDPPELESAPTDSTAADVPEEGSRTAVSLPRLPSSRGQSALR